MRSIINITLVLTLGAASARAAQFTIAALPAPAGASYVSATAISPGGIVGGTAFVGNWNTLDGYYQPLTWQGGIPSALPLEPGMSGAVSGVNDAGAVAGGVWPGEGPSASGSPELWFNGQAQALPTAGIAMAGTAGISAQVEVVGSAQPAGGGAEFAALWSGGTVTQLGNFPGVSSYATAINGRGQILLNVGDGSFTDTYVWDAGSLTPVPAITGNVAQGTAINNAGEVVGTSIGADGAFHAFLWEDGRTTDLGMTPGALWSAAVGINNAGAVVGYEYTQQAEDGLLWSGSQLYKLADLLPADSGWSNLQPAGISNAGVIVGTGLFEGSYQAFIMAPTVSPSAAVPEPASLAILALGATALLRRRRR